MEAGRQAPQARQETQSSEGKPRRVVRPSRVIRAEGQAAHTTRDTLQLLHGERYTIQSTQGQTFTGCAYDAPTWRFLLGRSGKALTLDAIAAVWDGRAFVEIGAWCAEPVCGGLAA